MRCFGRSNAPKVPVRPKDVSQNDRDAAAVRILMTSLRHKSISRTQLWLSRKTP